MTAKEQLIEKLPWQQDSAGGGGAYGEAELQTSEPVCRERGGMETSLWIE